MVSNTSETLKKVKLLLDKAKLSENSSDKKLTQQDEDYLYSLIKSLERINITLDEENILYTSLYTIARGWCEEKEDILADYYLGRKKFGYYSQILWMTTMYLLVVWQRYSNDNYMQRLVEILTATPDKPHLDDPDQYVRDITAKNAGEEYIKKFPNGKYFNEINTALKLIK